MQVLAYSGQVGDDVDPERAQMLGRADPGEQEQLRGADRAAADDDLIGVRVPVDHSTPTQRVPSKSRRCAAAPVTISRLSFASTGRIYAAAVL